MTVVAVIPGDDAAPEAVRPTVELLSLLVPDLEWLHPPSGASAIETHGSGFPDEARHAVDSADATLFGAASDASAGAIFHLRWNRDAYINLRPVRSWPNARSPLVNPDGIDFVIVREGVEDLYMFLERDLADVDDAWRHPMTGRPVREMAPGTAALKVITDHGSERIARAAFEMARARRDRLAGADRGEAGEKQTRVTCGAKHNILAGTDGRFVAAAERVAAEFPDVEFEVFYVDDLARRMVSEPQRLDVVLLPNLYGDLYSDLAAGLIGGLGLAPSASLGDGGAVFEPCHGTAPDIAGLGTINPTATMLSGAMLLGHLGHGGEADQLEAAIEAVYRDGRFLTPDQGGTSSTAEFTSSVAAALT